MKTCAGTRRDGEPCKSRIVLADGFCSAHSPTRGTDMVALGGRGGIASGEARRELGKSVRERLAERLEEDADEIYDSFQTAWRDGDWRAADAAISQALGRPAIAIVGDVDQPLSFRIVSAFSTLTGDEPLELNEGSS